MRATPPSRADVGGDALERHDRARARVLRDPRLLGVDDVHDHAALQHLRQTRLHPQRPVLVAHAEQSSHGTFTASFPPPCGWTRSTSPNLRLSACGNLLEKLAIDRTMWKRYPLRRDSSPHRRKPGPKLRRSEQGARPPGLLARSAPRSREIPFVESPTWAIESCRRRLPCAFWRCSAAAGRYGCTASAPPSRRARAPSPRRSRRSRR